MSRHKITRCPWLGDLCSTGTAIHVGHAMNEQPGAHNVMYCNVLYCNVLY